MNSINRDKGTSVNRFIRNRYDNRSQCLLVMKGPIRAFHAGMAESADAWDLKSQDFQIMRVQVPLPVLGVRRNPNSILFYYITHQRRNAYDDYNRKTRK